ncbi:WecB/TagA/CpsF family glycosyltransferase [Catellatospora bangladeshensis]|uniref:UDP-N-acetyl-D-mannosaminuronic acid transferase n=1 Tax=Catellatospora bangladeshensis TaxID=310355 RepID=A0A8J3JIE7_9ACTN|nr:WecB/TagA/CpsF family glycosyltransferase [Catellatospora bangladeshensis]GIF81211.1 UDP-N-acetyl-D-mannosaminuronic acid transferase [Catellatospora bangladeshensis]
MTTTPTTGSKRNVLGVFVDATDYADATERIIRAATEGRPFAVTALAVHGVMEGVADSRLGAQLNSFDLITPDGQPVRWALNLLHGAGLRDRVYGPELTLRVLARAAEDGLPVYLYGSTQPTLDRLIPALIAKFPGLKIAGSEPSKFRGVEPGEPEQIAARIAGSGARIVLVGLGCPRQEKFTYAMRPFLDMPLLAVGAAFDYHAGGLRKPPAWMQRHALEWLWRLGLEPKRLWRRYLILNPKYLARLGAQKTRLWRATPATPATDSPATFAV